jgi:hypothetical protein
MCEFCTAGVVTFNTVENITLAYGTACLWLPANILDFKLGLGQFYYAIDWSEVRKGRSNENKMELWILMQWYISRSAHCSYLSSFRCPYWWTCKYQNSWYQIITHVLQWLTLLAVTCLIPCKYVLKLNYDVWMNGMIMREFTSFVKSGYSDQLLM